MPNKINWSQYNINRFWSKVNYPGNDQDCWEWQAHRDKKGYGKYDGGRASRFAYEFYNGPITNGLLVCHTCDNPPCCNPEHLFLGTTQENTQDKIDKGRQIRGSDIGTAILTEDDVREIMNNILLNKYSSVQDILINYPIAKPTFENIIYKNGWSHIREEFDMLKIKNIISNFKKNKHQKLMSNDVKEIKKKLSEGLSYQELANFYNVDPKTISDIKTGRSWKKVII